MRRFAFAAAALLLATAPIGADAPPTILVDGATLRAEVGGQQRTIHLIGLFAPKDSSCIKIDLERFAPKLSTALRLEQEPGIPAEADGALLRYASDTANDLGAELVKRGLAIPGAAGYAKAERYVHLAAVARANHRGLWAPRCAAALQTILVRPPPPVPLPHVDPEVAAQAIAELEARNASGENVVEFSPVRRPQSDAPSRATARTDAPTRGSDEQRPSGASQRPGEAWELLGPRIRRVGSNSVHVSGKYWNPGDTEVSGQLRIELRDGSAIVDSTTVRMTIPPRGERQYTVTLSPGMTSDLVALVTWQGR